MFNLQLINNPLFWRFAPLQLTEQARPQSIHQSLVTNHKEQSTSHQSHAYSAWVTTRSAKGCGATALFTGPFEVGWADHTENKGLYYRQGEGWPLSTNKNVAFFIIKFQINIFLAMTVQFDAVQCVFYYKINKTLLLGNFTVQTLLIRSPSLKSTLSAFWAGGAQILLASS